MIISLAILSSLLFKRVKFKNVLRSTDFHYSKLFFKCDDLLNYNHQNV